MIVYLGGPINGCTDDEAHGWREQVKPILEADGHEWLDPMDRDYRGRELEPSMATRIVENGTAVWIVESDKADIDACDVLLMNCLRPSVGTSMEVYYGWASGKRVLTVVPADAIPSPWLVYHSETMRGSIIAAASSL